MSTVRRRLPPAARLGLALGALLAFPPVPADAAAYTAFDEVITTEPAWRVAWPEAGGIRYRVRPLDLAGRVAMDVTRTRAPGTPPGDLLLSLAGSAPPRAVPLDDAGRATVLFAGVRLDHGLLLDDPLRLWRIDGIAVAPPPRREQPTTASAYSVYPVAEVTGFRARALIHVATRTADGRIDLHLRSTAPEAIHAEFAPVDGRPLRRGALPRLHLAPGTTTELLLPPMAGIDPARLMIAVWDVRLGEDRGPVLAPDPGSYAPFAPADGFRPVVVAGWAQESARFEPRSVVWSSATAGAMETLRLRNRGDRRVGADLRRRGLPGAPEAVRIDLPPGAELAVPLPVPPAGVRTYVELDGLALDGVRLDPPAAANRLEVPAVAQAVTPAVVDPRFNPLALRFLIAPGGETAGVTLFNTTAGGLECDLLIPGYQDGLPPNPRVRLEAGQTVTVVLPVVDADPRLVLAPLTVSRVRLDGAGGDLLCVPPAR